MGIRTDSASVVVAATQYDKSGDDSTGDASNPGANIEYTSSNWGNKFNGKALLHMDDVGLTDSGYANHTTTLFGTAARSAVQSKFGGYSMLLDGNSDYLTIADSPDFDFSSGQPFRMEAWIYITTINSFNTIFGKKSGATNGWAIWIRSGGNVEFKIDSTEHNLGGVITASTWHHVEFSFDGTDLRYFLDGVLTGTKTSMPSITDTATDFTIGKDPRAGGTSYFTGYIDEVFIDNAVGHTSGFTPETSAYSTYASSDNGVEYDAGVTGTVVIAPSTLVVKDNAGSTVPDTNYNIAYNQNGAGFTSLITGTAFKALSRVSGTTSWITKAQAIDGAVFDNVIIDTTSSASRLKADGVVHEVDGVEVSALRETGVEFPDGSIQEISVDDMVQDLQNVVGMNFLYDAIDHARSVVDFGDEFSDVFTDETGVDTGTSTAIHTVDDGTYSPVDEVNSPSFSFSGITSTSNTANIVANKVTSNMVADKVRIRTGAGGSFVIKKGTFVSGTTYNLTDIATVTATGGVEEELTIPKTAFSDTDIIAYHEDAATNHYAYGGTGSGLSSFFVSGGNDTGDKTFSTTSASTNYGVAAVQSVSPTNFLLQTLAKTVTANPTKGYIVLWHEEVDASTMNTDFTGKISIDNGVTFTDAVTFTFKSQYSATVDIYISGLVDLSAQTGSQLVIKYEAANGKEQKVHGHFFGVSA